MIVWQVQSPWARLTGPHFEINRIFLKIILFGAFSLFWVKHSPQVKPPHHSKCNFSFCSGTFRVNNAEFSAVWFCSPPPPQSNQCAPCESTSLAVSLIFFFLDFTSRECTMKVTFWLDSCWETDFNTNKDHEHPLWLSFQKINTSLKPLLWILFKQCILVVSCNREFYWTIITNFKVLVNAING